MELTADTVEKAVHQFYCDAANQQSIHQWLTVVQVTPQAWTFSWQLLDKSKAIEVQFFGATCIHTKVSKFWNELSSEQIGELRHKLFEQVINYSTGPKMILTRLCCTLATYVTHTIPDAWPDAIGNIIQTFDASAVPNLDPSQSAFVLLQFLTVLPEECTSAHLASYRKGLVRGELMSVAPKVIQLLRKLLETGNSPDLFEQCLKCFGSWAAFGLPLPEVQPIILHVFQAVKNESLFDSSIDALVNLFLSPDNYRYPNTIPALLQQVLLLNDLLEKSIQENDMEACQGLTRLVVSAGDSNTKLLLTLCLQSEETRQIALNLIQMILRCTSLPGHYPVDEGSSDLPFGFWYNLQDDILAAEDEHQQILSQIFVPIYFSLVNSLLIKAQYPDSAEYESWNADEKEQRRCYRQDIADTVMYSYNLLNESVLSNLCQLLTNLVSRGATEQVRWQEYESALFIITSLAESVDPGECSFLPTIFTMLGQVPCDNYKIVSQSLHLIGAYAEWISVNPKVLSSVIPLLLQGLKHAELAQPTTLAFKEVARENQIHLIPYIPQILASAKENLESGHMKSRDTMRFMSCLGYILSVIPVADSMEFLNAVFTPHMQRFEQLANEEMSAAGKLTITQTLSMLSWLFGSLNTKLRDGEDEGGRDEVGQPQSDEPQPVLLLMQQVLPFVKNVLGRWASDLEVVECACDMLKTGIRTLMDEFSPLATDVIQMLVSMYEAMPHSSILDLSKQILILFSRDTQHSEATRFLFQSLCNKTLGYFENGEIRNHPDLMENFMILLAQVTKKCSVLYVNGNINYETLFHAGVLALSAQEAPTVRATCSFLSEYLSLCERLEPIKLVLANHGAALVDRLLRSVGGESPRAVVDSMADVFFALNKQAPALLSQCLQQMITTQGFPSPKATQQDKEQFTKRVLRERSNKKRMRDVINEYTLMWRGLIGTEYAAQTASILDTPT